MTSYFQLRDDVELPKRWNLSTVLDAEGDEPRLAAGLPFQGTLPLKVEMSVKGLALDFCTTSFNVPIVNESLARAVEEVAGSYVESIPIRVVGHRPAMRVLNAVRLVRCLNEKHSEFIKWTKRDHRADLVGQYRQVTKLVLNADAIPADAHFFRIEGWRVALIVSAATKRAMERVGCKGARFIPLSC